MKTLEFWYEFASTYSYLAAMRLPKLAETAGIEVVYRPFLLGPIFKSQGWLDSPFNLYPAKGRYMQRDLERQCAKYGLPWHWPSQFPRNGLLAARMACLGLDLDWGAAFSQAVYRAEFAENRDIGDPGVLIELLQSLGLDAPPLLEKAQSQTVKDRLRQHTEDAMRLGIFGAPTFRMGEELFWGNDRLDEALEWCIEQS